MILVTVGTQLPFDRLIRHVDGLAASMEERFVAQIGEGTYVPGHMEWHRFMPPPLFDRLLEEARVIISHAGVGTVLNAYHWGKPVILFPRQSELGEHRNDHQMATIEALAGRKGIYIERTGEAIAARLAHDLEAPDQRGMMASRQSLLDAMTRHIRVLAADRRRAG